MDGSRMKHRDLHHSRRDFLRNMGAATLTIAVAGLPNAALTAERTQWLQVGVCGSSDNWQRIKDAGCDYVEEGVGKLLNPRAADAEMEKVWSSVKEKGVVVRACNGFLPGDLKLVGPEARHEEALAYASKALARAPKLGIKYIVLGSGGARKVPEGFERSKAEDQFVAFLLKLAPVAADNGVTVAMESLNRSETNLGTTVAECLRYAKAVDHKGFRLTADLYHMLREDEGPEILQTAAAMLVHCHVAEKAGRTPPGQAGDDFKPYLRILKKSAYNGGMSLECRWKNMLEELPAGVKALREQIAAV